MERRGNHRSRALDHGDPRTPMAWQHRDINYQQQHHGFSGRFSTESDMMQEECQYLAEQHKEDARHRGMPRDMRSRIQHHRPNSPSTETSESTTATETESQLRHEASMQLCRQGPVMGNLHPMQSMQMLALPTWDGEPCPVHHWPIILPEMPPLFPQHALLPRKAMSSFDLRMDSEPPPPMYGSLPPLSPPPLLALPPIPSKTLEKSLHGSMLMLPLTGRAPPFPPHGPNGLSSPIPTQLLPPMMRPRPLVLPAENTTSPEPLPVRDPRKMTKTPTPLPHKDNLSDTAPRKSIKCCAGHRVVIWIIMSIILLGIILAVVLRFVFV